MSDIESEFHSPLAVYQANQFWDDSRTGPGMATVKVELLSYEADAEYRGGMPFLSLNLSWEGEIESPELWHIRWFHFATYLGNELKGYLELCSPAPAELWRTLLGCLPLELRAYFKDKTQGAPEP